MLQAGWLTWVWSKVDRSGLRMCHTDEDIPGTLFAHKTDSDDFQLYDDMSRTLQTYTQY